MIEFCKAEDASKVMKFIHNFWKQDHILSTSKEIFDYQYYNPDEDRYNIVVSTDENGDIDCILGFIPTSKFDNSFSEKEVLWLSLWKTRDDAANPFVGIMVYSHLRQEYGDSFIATNGMSDIAEKLYESLGFHVESLHHLYIVNPTFESFKIASSPTYSNNHNDLIYDFELLTDSSLDTYKKTYSNNTSYKTFSYLFQKYSSHPYYAYFYLAFLERNIVLVCREVHYNQRKILRIVDFCGHPDSLADISRSLELYITNHDYEYVDLLLNIDISTKESSRFVCNDPNSNTIIPNYFEPFESRNVEIKFAMHPTLKDGYFVTKGDGDQDRPSLIKELDI